MKKLLISFILSLTGASVCAAPAPFYKQRTYHYPFIGNWIGQYSGSEIKCNFKPDGTYEEKYYGKVYTGHWRQKDELTIVEYKTKNISYVYSYRLIWINNHTAYCEKTKITLNLHYKYAK